MWDLAPQPEMEPTPPAVQVQSPNHATTREVLSLSFLDIQQCFIPYWYFDSKVKMKWLFLLLFCL